MKDHTVKIVPIIVAAFIPWIILVSAETSVAGLGEPWFFLIQYVLAVLLFAIAFSMYFRANPKSEAFEVTIASMISIVILEAVYWNFIFEGDAVCTGYIHWIVPMFLIATTIYTIGRQTK
jgi:hypothetical protein